MRFVIFLVFYCYFFGRGILNKGKNKQIFKSLYLLVSWFSIRIWREIGSGIYSLLIFFEIRCYFFSVYKRDEKVQSLRLLFLFTYPKDIMNFYYGTGAWVLEKIFLFCCCFDVTSNYIVNFLMARSTHTWHNFYGNFVDSSYHQRVVNKWIWFFHTLKGISSFSENKNLY